MKVGPKTRTLRGQLTSVGSKAEKNIIVDDLRINHGLIVREFVIWPTIMAATTSLTATAILSYAALGNANEKMDAGDNTQFAWHGATLSFLSDPSDPGAGQIRGYDQFNYIDPNHIVNRDMFVSLRNANGTWNYMIICDEVELTDNEAIITIIKENSQGLTPP